MQADVRILLFVLPVIMNIFSIVNMKCHRLLLVNLLIFTALSRSMMAQDTDFWFVAPQLDSRGTTTTTNFNRPVYFMITAGDLPAVVTMEMPALPGFNNRTISLVAGESQRIIFGVGYTAFENAQMDTIQNNILNVAYVGVKHNRGIHFRSTAPVTIYYQVDSYNSKDMYALKGTKALGLEFYTPFQDIIYTVPGSYPDGYPQFHVVASEDNTTVQITPKSNIVGTNAGVTKTVVLNRGETFAARSVTATQAGRLTGSHVFADKPVAVTVTDDLLNVPSGGSDATGDQLVPVANIGTSYVVVRGFLNTTNANYCDKVFVMATHDNTTVTIDGTVVTTTLAKGAHYVHTMQTALTAAITADYPVYVFQLSGYGTEVGAVLVPSMYSIFSRKISFYKDPASYNHNIFVLVRDGNKGDFTVNGNAAILTASDFTPVPNMPGWNYARKDISATVASGTVVINNSSGAFSLGYFYTGAATGASASFGYLSQFGSLAFADTTFVCDDASVTLDAGYAKSYLWTLPDGTTRTTPAITVSDTGMYTVTVDLDPTLVTASTHVLRRFEGSGIVSSSIQDMGAGTYTYTANPGLYPADHVGYAWFVDGLQVGDNTASLDTVWQADDEKTISLQLYDTITTCTKTHTLIHRKYPDNMVSDDCIVPFTPINFNVHQQLSMTAGDNQALTGLLVGDLDGDGLPEIVAYYGASSGQPNQLRVMNGQTGAMKASLTLPNMYASGGWCPTMTAVLVDADRNGMGEIILATNDGYLNSYEADTTGGVFSLAPKWGPVAFASPPGIAAIDRSPQPIVADFNGDGVPEVVVFNQIFNAATGAYLGETEPAATAHTGRNPNYSAYNKGSNFQTVADMDGDGLPEIVAGGKVYKVSINAAGTVATCSILYQNTTVGDGFTAVADIDMDGLLDVVVTHTTTSNTTVLYVWTPAKSGNPGGGLMASVNVIGTYAHSYPFIGDIDGLIDPTTGKKHPEICVTIIDNVYAYKYVGATGTLARKWTLPTSDHSGGTGITLFDFNNDGIAELVYRDETLVRILNGSADNVQPTLASPGSQFSCTSSTAWEYPVIADMDGDGSANICVTCTGNNLRVYESAGMPWAPTRPVWNQVNYEPLYINDDLTVPKFPFVKNKEFNGAYPYNGALIQVPIVDHNFDPVVQASDAALSHLWIERQGVDSVYVHATVSNIGMKNTHVSLPLSLYLNDTIHAAFETRPVGTSLMPGDAITITFGLKISEMTPRIAARVQDDGTVFPVMGYLDCVLKNNYRDIAVWAIDDTIQLLNCYPDTIIDVLANDTMIHCARNDISLSLSSAKAGNMASVDANKNIIYTYPDGFTGRDTLEYFVTCNDTTRMGRVFITVVPCPDNIDMAECTGDPPVIDWDYQLLMMSPATDVVSNDVIPIVGDIDNDGKIEIIAAGAKTGSFHSNVLFVFEVDGAAMTRQQRLVTPYFCTINNPYAIANVDGGPFAALFVATTVSNNTSVADQGQLIKYVYDGTQYVESWRRPYTTSNTAQSPQPMLADFNGDGVPEILVYDKIFNARTGDLLVDAGYLSNPVYGFGLGGHGASGYTGWTPAIPYAQSSIMAIADIDGDGRPEVIGGNSVYKVNIVNPAGTAGNSFVLFRQADATGRPEVIDGLTAVADMNGDGLLEVIVTTSYTLNTASLYIWDPRTGEILNTNVIDDIPTYPHAGTGASVAFIGDIDGDNLPEICLSGRNTMRAYDYDRTTKQLTSKWIKTTVDDSGATTMVLFDFDQDGNNELVYRDQTNLRIINGMDGTDKIISSIACYSATANEYPVVADVNNDGAAEIVVTGGTTNAATSSRVMVFSSKTIQDKWAPTRRVWNQFAYNAVNVNDDLTIPALQMNPATFFPNHKQPFNGYLMQQTLLNMDGDPLWILPDIFTDASLVNCDVVGDSVSITIGIVNQGAATIWPPLYVSLYNETDPVQTFSSANLIVTHSENMAIPPGETVTVTIPIPDITLHFPLTGRLVIRLNDDGVTFPYHAECDTDNDTLSIANPAIRLMMKKKAAIVQPIFFPHDGTVANPVATLFGDTVEYTITVVNASATAGTVKIVDTIPLYLDYAANSAAPFITLSSTVGPPPRHYLEWSLSGVPSLADTTVTFRATPLGGVNASQPMFINQAIVITAAGDTVLTNVTYHQGVGVSLVTFSAGWGGSIYHATEHALDYRTSPLSGVVVVPDEGYRFAGWSHTDYPSLRGETIHAQKGVMRYDTLTVYGDVNLNADFALETYTIAYHLHGGINAKRNPASYTVESEVITLEAPEKEGDVFVGWTGSNGDVPQPSVTIPPRSTGERTYFANYLYSGATLSYRAVSTEDGTDRIWAAENELHVWASKPGGIVRIYSMEGVLQRQQVIRYAGETAIRLPVGLYVATLNNGIGQIVRIE